MADESTVRDLVWNPRESLVVELKAWFDPKSPAGQAKIARCALAMRNHGGGFMVVGFDNVSHAPVAIDRPPDVRAAFHADIVQSIVSRFASEAFEVAVHFVQRDGADYPVVEIPPGVRTPVAAKSDLPEGGRMLVACNRVYVRSLDSNGTASTTEAGWKDWARLLDICFDNREADIGRFVRRHLAGLSHDALRDALEALRGATTERPSQETISERVTALLDHGRSRFDTVIRKRTLELPPHGSWETGAIVRGAPPMTADLSLRNALLSSNPNLTGWPVWVDSREFGMAEARPYLEGDAWEALVAILDGGFAGNQLDFWRLSARAEFYLYRAFKDDLQEPQRLAPCTQFDFGLPLLRTTEALAVGLDFAKALGAVPDTSSVAFGFRWQGLKDRVLTNWAHPQRVLSPWRRAYRDQVESFVDVPVDTPRSALHQFVHTATKPLYEAFDGFEVSERVCGEFASQLFGRGR